MKRIIPLRQVGPNAGSVIYELEATDLALVLSKGIDFRGQISDNDDVDQYIVKAYKSGFFSIDFEAPRYNYYDYKISIFNSSGEVLASTTTSSSKQLGAGVSAAGDYYVLIESGESYYSAPAGEYALSLSFDSDLGSPSSYTPPAVSSPSTTPVTTDSSPAGNSGDVDWDIRLTGFFDKTMPAQINEGETLEIALKEASYSADFASVKISGISLDDLSYRDTDLSDSLLATSSTGYLSTYVNLKRDELTEGDETLVITATLRDSKTGHEETVTRSVIVKDTSVSTPDWDIRVTGFFDAAFPSEVDEGETLEISIKDRSYTADSVFLKVTGISSDDILYKDSYLDESLEARSGSFSLSTYLRLKEDELTEGDETLLITATLRDSETGQEKTVTRSVIVKDTSVSNALKNSDTYSLDVIVDLLGNVILLKGLTETISGDLHTVEYNGISFDWSEVGSFLMPVVRDSEFTDEFSQEIADAYPSFAGISYKAAVAFIGTSSLDDVLLMVAGADGSYVN